MYAGRKRRKPVQRGAKPVPVDGTKTNPSKRHRERLNSELERLAGLLPFPQEVTSSLDKLSILRLSVSFLRSKSFFSVALKNQPSNGSTVNTAGHENGKTTGSDDGSIPEGELLLQALNGFVLVVTADGVIFFSSHTIQEYLGFQQTDVMYQSVFELIHSEDQLEFRRNLHWALDPSTSTQPGETETEQVSTSSPVTYDPQHIPPENSSFLERGFVCRFRCLLDNSSGFLAMNVQGRLKYLHGQNLRQRQADGQPSTAPPRLALFAIASPLQTPAILEIRTRNLIFRTKHKLDFTPMACDAKGKMVLGYTEAELRVRGSGYQFIHAADMLYCAENHIRMIKTGESGLTVFRLLTKENRWKWVQANARLVYKNGKPDYIIATQRPLVEEEGGEHLRKRSLHLPFTFATGEALLYHTSFPLHGFPDPHQAKTKAKGGKAKRGRQDRSSKDELDPNSLLGAVMSQDESVYVCEPAAVTKTSFHGSLFSEQGAGSLAGWRGDTGWNMSTNESEGDSKVSGYDPLLSTLDSLSLDGDETCSNSELFSALESLGLEAEDLELLLLDKRMVQVELDPGHIPTLSDLLTNNEILSFVHDSLEGSSGAGDTGGGVGSGPPDLTVQSSAGHQPGPQLTGSPHLSQFQTPTSSRQRRQPPIVKLSQQMHQHINATQLAKAPPWAGHISLSQPGTINPNPLAGVHNSHWQENHFNSHEHTNSLQAQPVASVSQLNSENKHLSQLLASKQPWQVQKDLMLLHIQAQNQRPEADTDLLWSGYRNPHGADLQNGHAPFSQVPLNGTNSTAGLNSAIIPNVSLCQGTVLATSANQPPSHHKHQQVLSTSLTELPVQNQSVDLEQFLVLSQPPCSMPSLEACGMFNTTVNHDGAASKENNCIISTSNAAYLRSCLLPNGNGVASTDVPVQDPQKAGFFSLAGAQLRLPE